MDGVLVSWAVPKGPTLDPKVRRLGVHVEDHPIEYFDFEGVIPTGEYGGGDVIVWDWGTWTPAQGPTTRSQAVADGELHVDLRRREAARPLRARAHRRGRRPQRQGAVARCSTSTTSTRSQGGTPEAASRSRCAAAAPTTRSRPTPDAHVAQRPPAGERRAAARVDFPTWDRRPPTLAALDALGQGGRLGVRRRHAASSPTSTRCSFPAATTSEKPLTKRDLIRYYAMVAPVMLPYLGTGRSTCTASRTASTSPASGTRRYRRTRRTGSRAGTTTTPTTARPSGTSSPTVPRRSRGSPTTARSSCTRGRRAIPTSTSRRTR